MKRLLVCAVLASVFGLPFAPARQAAAAPNAFEGRRIFTANCLVCHGVLGDGKGPLAAALKKAPTDLTSADVAAKSNRDLMLIIIGGKSHEEGLGMPSWSTVLLGTQTENVIAYVRYLQKTRISLIGDPDQGRALYASYCVLCHGVEGKGDGVMIKLLTIRPADHTNTAHMDTLSNEQLARTISEGVSARYMPGWKAVLTPSEIDSLVGYIRVLAR
jgi:mono/diheme cytochrome c family protein